MANNSEKLITLATQKFGQLTDADRKLFRAVARHEVANFKADVDELNQPESAEQWGSVRTLKADRLVWLLTTPEASQLLSFRGLRISGAKIEGELNLEYATISVPLIFESCVFTEPLILQKSKLRELQMQGSYVSGIKAAEMHVESSVFLSDCFKAVGEVILRGASIGGLLSCIGGEFSNEGGTAIQADAATISASVFLSNSFKAVGEVILLGASIGGALSCIGGEFSNQGGTAINAGAATITASVYLRNGFKAVGEVILRRVSIGGQLDCSESEFSNQGKTAINADAAKITADVFLCDGFKAEGEVILRRASIGGQLDCSGGEFSNQDGTAINAGAVTIAADVFLSNGLRDLRLNNVPIKFWTMLLNIDCLAGILFLRKSLKAVGMVNLRGASIGGQLDCSGGEFSNEGQIAINADSATIGGSVFLGGESNNSQFQAKGEMTFLNASIDDRLELESIESNNSASIILDLRFAKVNTFSFKDCQAEESWIKQIKEGQLCLNGFVYSTINVTNAAIKDNTLKKWLQLQIEEDSDPQSENGFFLQPYEQLATVLKANGHQKAATKVLIAKEDDRRRYGSLTGWGKVWNRILGVTIAHGYRPQKALVYSVVVMLIGWGVFYRNQGLMAKTKDHLESSAVFNPLVYSIDTFTPIIDLHQQKMWLPDASEGKERYIFHPSLKRRSGDWLRRYFWFQIIAGWVLTSLWVAGFTGLVRNQK